MLSAADVYAQQSGGALAPDAVPATADAPTDAAGNAPPPTIPVSSSPTPAAPTPANNRFVEEIVVTAQRREENIQTVPISVTALSGALLEAKGIDDPSKLADITPGLTYNSATGFSIIYIRGIGSDAFLTADPSVASYIDGVYYPFSSGLAQSFGRVERVEVLKGPQGTLFGRNSTGGAISITTETPSRTFTGAVETGYSSYNTSKSNLFLSGPLGNQFSASVALLYDRADNYYTFTSDSVDQNLPIELSQGIRAKLRWTPTANFDATLSFTKINQAGVSTALAPNTAVSPLAALLGAKSQPRNYTATLDSPLKFTVDSTVYTGNAKWTLDGLDIKGLVSDQRINNIGETDFDGTNADIISFQAKPLYAHVRTGELQLLSNRDSWAAKYLESIAGLYYFYEKAGLKPTLSLFGGENGDIALENLPPLGLQTLEGLLPGPLQNALGPLPFVHGANVALSGEVATESFAGYAQSTAHLTDWLALTVGARYQRERRQATNSTFGLENADGSTTQIFDFVHDPAFGLTPLTKNTYQFSPKASLSFTPIDDVLFYASWQKAYKSGTYNIINIYTSPEYALPEKVRAEEFGVKSEFFNHVIRFNAALFQTSVKNLQVQFVSLLNGGAVSIENAPYARSRGADFDTLLQILPSKIDGLVLTAGGAYIDAVYTSYPHGSGFNPQTGLFETNQNYSGNQIARTPKYSGTVALSKTTTFDWGSFEAVADGDYNSGYAYLAQDTLFRERWYYLINARVSALYDPWNLRVSVFGDNLNDRVHALGQFPNDFGRLESLAPPRTVGVRFNYSF